MKCLVTGGAGFIGSHLCERLLDEGHEVICVDNLLTGSEKNISHFKHKAEFSFVKHDCSLPLGIETKVDLIFHLASPASPPKYQQYPIETMLVNTNGTYHLLELARKNNARFVFASTSEVYGDPLTHPQTEEYWGNVNPVGERSCYDESKRAGETYVAIFVHKFALDARIIRIFNTYGPRMDIDDGRVVTNFIKQILTEKPLTINGSGQQTRSFCYVSDMVEGLIQVGTRDGLNGEIINLGSTDERTVLELAQLIQKIAEYKGELKYQDLPSDDPVRRRPDITRAEKLLDWRPMISLNAGLKTTLEYFRKIINFRE